MMPDVLPDVLVVGAGVFGAAAAQALARRGARVALVDPGPVPHPLAESTDLSKIVRLDYGSDEQYTAWMERALDGWRAWNARWPSPLYHETGVLFVRRDEMRPGGFEHDSFAVLSRRGHAVERMTSDKIAARFPAWHAREYVDGYFNPEGGWAEAGRVVARLVEECAGVGVELRPGVTATELLTDAGRVTGIVDRAGAHHAAGAVVVCAGAWTPRLCPWLADDLFPVGQPVFHFTPARPRDFEAVRFPVFGADLSRTGWYGFPVAQGVVKIANHGVGRRVDPSSATERTVTPYELADARAFLSGTFPALADAPIAATRICVYGDSRDGHFWIAPDPDLAGLVVAAGGSGHAFKFAPLVGDWVADTLAGTPDPALARFRHRPGVPAISDEKARHQGVK